jgi:hypothetical protein
MDAICSSWRTLSSSQTSSELDAMSAGRGDAPLQLVMAKGCMLHRKNCRGKAAIESAKGLSMYVFCTYVHRRHHRPHAALLPPLQPAHSTRRRHALKSREVLLAQEVTAPWMRPVISSASESLLGT